jgi:hypothetical protein
MSVACGANDKLHPARVLWRGLGRDGHLGQHPLPHPDHPRHHQKRLTPMPYFRLARGTRVTLWQDGELWGPPSRSARSR